MAVAGSLLTASCLVQAVRVWQHCQDRLLVLPCQRLLGRNAYLIFRRGQAGGCREPGSIGPQGQKVVADGIAAMMLHAADHRPILAETSVAYAVVGGMSRHLQCAQHTQVEVHNINMCVHLCVTN